LCDELFKDLCGCAESALVNQDRRALQHWKKQCVLDSSIVSTRTTITEGFKRIIGDIDRESPEYFEIADKILRICDQYAVFIMCEEGADKSDENNDIKYMSGQIFIMHKCEYGAMQYCGTMSKTISYIGQRIMCKLQVRIWMLTETVGSQNAAS
jgi:hypothetical protein